MCGLSRTAATAQASQCCHSDSAQPPRHRSCLLPACTWSCRRPTEQGGFLTKLPLLLGVAALNWGLEHAGAQAYDPVLEWAESAMQTSLAVSDSIFGTEQEPAAIQAVQAYLQGVVASTSPDLELPRGPPPRLFWLCCTDTECLDQPRLLSSLGRPQQMGASSIGLPGWSVQIATASSCCRQGSLTYLCDIANSVV